MEDNAINEIHEEILKWIKSMSFKKKIIGGVDEEDVLKKIEELNSLYEKALISERIRYNTLLNQYKKGGDTNE